jgi:ADP-ribose pyrophosphatase
MPDRSWTLLGSREIARFRVLRFREDRYRFEPTGAEAPFAVCESADWVEIIAVTDDRRAVFVRQFRHGVREVVLEIPGGLIEAGETPEAAAVRELEEETGYAGRQARLLARLLPNPALNTAACYVVLVEGCRQVSEPAPDPFEQIEVLLHPLQAVPEMIRSGELCHAQVIAAFACLQVLPFGEEVLGRSR